MKSQKEETPEKPDFKSSNPDKVHFDKMLLKELVWKLDREVWAHVPNPEPSEEWTTSKAREETKKLIAEYIGHYDDLREFVLAHDNEAINLELLEALKGIERLCDGNNPAHENIWRIANSMIQRAESAQKKDDHVDGTMQNTRVEKGK